MASGTAGSTHLSGALWTRGCWHHDRRSRSTPLCPLFHGRSPQQCSSSTTCLWVLSSMPMVLHALCMLTQTFLFNVYLHIFKFLGRWLKYLPAHWSHCFCSCFPTFCLFQQLFYRFPGGEKKEEIWEVVTPLYSENLYIPHMWPWERNNFWGIKLQSWGTNF